MQVPQYTKFMKELVTKKRVIGQEAATLQIGEIFSMMEPLPKKQRDPGSFTIPCSIGTNPEKFMALCDLGASINLMPYSVYQQLGLTEMRPTKTTLQMADRSIREPRGVVEDVLV